MTDEELSDALDGLMAYDHGATDSGIHDEDLRERCKQQLREMTEQPHPDFPSRWIAGKHQDRATVFLSQFVAERCVSDDAIRDGYGIEDAKRFIDWLDEHMDYTI